ncbi:hypothetical protein ABT255_47790 [Streptomyces mirabilis]|uniref:hypothetical protein n=1 Tax=Streptomyces mirabilis TaxID=68239 RepID=UPI003325EA3F
MAGDGTATLEGQRMDCGCGNYGYLHGYPKKAAAIWNISYSASCSDTSAFLPITEMYR